MEHNIKPRRRASPRGPAAALLAGILAGVGCGGGGSNDDPDAGAPDLGELTEAEALFAEEYLPVYRVTMGGGDWAGAWDELVAAVPPGACDVREFLAVDLDFENPWTGKTETYEEVGFRIRGHDTVATGDCSESTTICPDLSQETERYGFKISFVHPMGTGFTKDHAGRRFHDHRRINLLSSEGDDSLLKQCLAYGLLRDFDVPTPWCNHALLYVNDDFVGVFQHVQERDDGGYPDNRFADDPDGSMYEVADCMNNEAPLEYIDGNPTSYEAEYQLLAGTTPEDMSADLIPFLQCAADADQAAFVACIGEHIDVVEWQHAIGAALALPDMDGWAASGSSFVFYHYGPGGGARRFVVFPWDMDRAFKDDCDENDADPDNEGTGKCHILSNGRLGEDVSPELVNRLREPPFRDDYCGAVEVFVNTLFNPDDMGTRVDHLRTVPRRAAKPFEGMDAPSLDEIFGTDTDPLFDYDTWSGEVDDLMTERFVPRKAALDDQLSTCMTDALVLD